MLLGITIGSLIPVSRFDIHAGDKLVHVLMYLLLMTWFAQVMESRLHSRVAILFITLGFLLEIAQHATGYRRFEWGDVLANLTGVLLGWVLVHSIVGRSIAWIDNRLAQSAHHSS